MATYDVELLDAARRLLARRAGQRGPLSSARVRRSISTSYYALFHFLLDEVGSRIVGSGAGLRTRRRSLVRVVSHKGIRVALGKVSGATVDPSIAAFMFPISSPPRFARAMSKTFGDAQAKRLDADYDLESPLNAADALLLVQEIANVIEEWRIATSPADQDFKHAVCILILLNGQLRKEA